MQDHISLVWTCMALAASCNVKLVFGQQPYATEDTICIVNPLGVPHEVLLGVIAHECGHRRFSDHKLLDMPDGLRLGVLNSIEDVRIEKRMCGIYRGARDFLSATVDHFMKEGWWGSPLSDDPLALFHDFVLYHGRVHYMDQNQIGPSLAETRERLVLVIGQDIVLQAEEIMLGIPALQSTGECLTMADQLLALLPQQQQNEEDQQEQQSDQSGDPNGSPAGKSEDQPENGDGDPQGQPNQGQGQSGQPGTPQGSPNSQTDQKQELTPGKELNLTQCVPDLGSKLLEVLNRSDSSYGKVPSVLPPTIVVAKGQQGDSIVNDARNASYGIRAQMLQILDASANEDTARKCSGTQIDRKRLRRADIDPRIFRKDRRTIMPDTRIHILADRSDSMTRKLKDQGPGTPKKRRIDIAMQATAALALACDGVEGVAVEVSGFSSSFRRNIVTPLLQEDERMSAPLVQGRFNLLTYEGTPTAEALLWASAKIANANEEKKILLLITDGEPNDVQKTKDALAVIARQAPDVRVLGIGIGDDARAIQQWLPSAIVLSDVGQLRQTLFGLTARVLTH